MLIVPSASGDVICIANGRVSINRLDLDARRFVVADVFALDLEDGHDNKAEVVTAAHVVDLATGIRQLTLGIRTASSDGTFCYRLGMLDVRSQHLDCLQTFHLSNKFAEAEHLMADGPVLCVLALTHGTEQCALAILRLAPEDLQGARTWDERAGGGGDQEQEVQLSGCTALLCTLSWSARPEDSVALCLGAPSTTSPAHVSDYVSDAPPQLIDYPLHPAGPSGSASRAAASRAAASRVPVASTFASTITCACVQSCVSGLDDSGCVLRSLRLWIATTSAVLHCCGCDGERAPLASISLPRVAVRVEVLPMLHGQDVVAVLCASAHSPARRTMLLLSPSGETLRTVDDVEGWHAADYLGCAHPQLLVRRHQFCAPSGADADSGMSGYALIGVTSTWADVPTPHAIATAGGPAARPLPGTGSVAAGARRLQLAGVTAALSERLGAGYRAIDDVRRASHERDLLAVHTLRLLQARAEGATQATLAADEVHKGGTTHSESTAGGRAICGVSTAEPVVDLGAFRAWSAATSLESLGGRRTVPPSEVDDGRSGAKASLAGTAAGHSLGSAAACTTAAEAAMLLGTSSGAAREQNRTGGGVRADVPKVSSLHHGFQQGYWLLHVGVESADTSFAQLSGTLVHPLLRLDVQCNVIRRLGRSQRAQLTLSAPLSSVLSFEDLEFDLLLTWQLPPHNGSPSPARFVRRATLPPVSPAAPAPPLAVMPAPADASPPLPRSRATPGWHHAIGTRVRLHSNGLFTASLAPRLPSALGSLLPPQFLPHGLRRTVSLVLEVPPGSCALYDLPATLAAVLQLQAAPSGGNGGQLGHGRTSGRLAYRSESLAISDGESAGTCLLVDLHMVGRCAELQLTACGAAHDAVLTNAIGVLRTHLPSEMSIDTSFGSATPLGLLRRVSLAIQAELAGAVCACEGFFAAVCTEAAPTTASLDAASAMAVQKIATLQSSTDAQVSLLAEWIR